MNDESTPASSSKTAVGAAAAAGLLEGLARDALVTGAVLFGLITSVAGATSGEPAWVAAGLSVGVVGLVLPFVALGRKWSVGRTWLVLAGVLAAEVATMTLIWTS